MSHATILICFWISLVVIIPIGLIVMFLWGKKAYRWTMKYISDKQFIIDAPIRYGRIIAYVASFYMIPGILLFLLFCVPVLYFGHLLKQENFIVQVIQVNHLKKDSPDLDEYRSTYNIDELYERAQKEPPSSAN
jgi:hypothetical protein